MEKQLDILSLTRNSCRQNKDPCSDKETIDVIKLYAKTSDSPVEVAKRKVGCNSEICLLRNSEFIQFARKKGVNISDKLDKNFKPVGPKENPSALSDSNIDNVLKQWSEEFKKFYAYDYCMIDFAENNGSLTKNIHTVLQNDKKCAACVINTDISTGRGKHWVAIFVDTRSSPNEVLFFNSSGNPPMPQIHLWMLQVSAELPDCKVRYGTGIVHQNGNSECGVYCLYFIRCMIEKVGYGHFMTERISDETMIEFRKYLYR